MKDQITKDMTIEQIFQTFPEKSERLAQEMSNHGLHCVGCSAATWETLEGGLLGHGKTEQQIEDLLQKLNEILDETFDPNTITLTPKAAEKYKSILKEEGKDTWSLRFGDKPAGCSGFEYVLDYSEKPQENDEIFHSSGIEIHVDKKQLPRLLGSIIDYVDGLNGAGFKISNPNSKSSCGCGSSHGY